MLVPYPGQDKPGAPIIPASPPVGYGICPDPLEDDGTGTRSAAAIFAGMEALCCCRNFILWRLLDLVSGGTYTFEAALNVANAWTFTNACYIAPGAIFVVEGSAVLGAGAGGLGTLYVGTPFFGIGHVLVGSGSDITVQPGGTIACSGTTAHPTTCTFTGDGSGPHCTLSFVSNAALTLDSTSVLTCNGPVTLAGPTTQTGVYTQSGAGAWRVPRLHSVSLAAAPVTIADARAYDIIYVGGGDNVSTTVPLTLAAPAAGTPFGLVVRVCMPGNNQIPNPTTSYHLSIITPGGGADLTANVVSGLIQDPVWVDFMVAADKNNGGALMWAAVAGVGFTGASTASP